MTDTGRGLGSLGQFGRRAHFDRDGFSHIGQALHEHFHYPLEQRDALFACGLGEGGEGIAGGFNGQVDVFLIAQGNSGRNLFGGRVDHVDGAIALGLDPFAVDIEFVIVTHCWTPFHAVRISP